jgi:hypothetical protein
MNATLLALTRLSLKPIQRPPPLIQRPQSSTPSPPLTDSKFHLFPNLPTELRLQIWNTILLTPATITVTQTRSPRNPFLPRFICVSGPPPLLATNRESRALALSLQRQGKIEHIFTSGNTRLFFNPDLDMLYFSNDVSPYKFFNNVPFKEILRIKRLAIQDTKLAEMRYGFHGSVVFKVMKGLEEFVIVFDREVEEGDHCGMCKEARREVGTPASSQWKMGWRVPTFGQWLARKRGDWEENGRERVYMEILGAWARGNGLWDWVWGVVHEGV